MPEESEVIWVGAPGGEIPVANDASLPGAAAGVGAAVSGGIAVQPTAPAVVGVQAQSPPASASAPSTEASPLPAGAEGVSDLDTPAALLAAGRKLFARYGYEGASVRAITSEAGANLGAITYHFGSKKTLYNRVVEACVSPLAGRVEAALALPLPVLDRLEAVVGAYFEHFGENPELPSLMLQELVAGGGPPEAAGPTMRRIYGLILGAIREGQAAGQIREGDPVLLGLSLISQPVFPMVVRVPVQMLTGLDMRDPGTRERVAAHVAKTVRAALEKRQEGGQ